MVDRSACSEERPQPVRAAAPTPTPTPSPSTGPAPGAGRAAVLLAMCLGLMLSMLNSTLVNVELPQIGVRLHASDSGLRWVADIYTLGYAGLLLPGGALGNRLGRRSAFLAGVGVFAVGSLLCASAPGMAVLLPARAVQAVGVAVMLPQTLSILVHEYAEPGARARAVGIWAGVASLGLAAGPVLGGVFVSAADWRTGFWVTLALAAVALAIGQRVIPRARHGRPAAAARVDLVGAVLGVAWPTALVYGLIESADRGWTDPWILAAFAVSALAAAAFALVEHRIGRGGARPLMPLGLWRAPGFVAANAAGLAYFLTLFGILFFYSQDLQSQLHRSALTCGLLFLPMTVCMAVLAPVAGRLAARYGTRPVLASGLAVTGLGCLALTTLPAGVPLPGLEWRFAVIGIGVGLMSSPMSNAAVSSVPAADSGTASAVHNTCRQIGSTLGVALLGVLVGHGGSGAGYAHGLHAAMLFCGILLLACAALVRILLRGPARPAAGAAS